MPLCPSELSLSPPTTQLFRPRAARAYTGPSWMQSYYSMSWVRPSWKYELKDSWQVTSWQQEALKQICGVWRPHCRRCPSCSLAPVRFWFLRGSAYAYTRSSLPELVWLVSFSGKQKKKKKNTTKNISPVFLSWCYRKQTSDQTSRLQTEVETEHRPPPAPTPSLLPMDTPCF